MGYPHSWIVSNGKSHSSGWFGIPLFQETLILINKQIYFSTVLNFVNLRAAYWLTALNINCYQLLSSNCWCLQRLAQEKGTRSCEAAKPIDRISRTGPWVGRGGSHGLACLLTEGELFFVVIFNSHVQIPGCHGLQSMMMMLMLMMMMKMKMKIKNMIIMMGVIKYDGCQIWYNPLVICYIAIEAMASRNSCFTLEKMVNFRSQLLFEA